MGGGGRQEGFSLSFKYSLSFGLFFFFFFNNCFPEIKATRDKIHPSNVRSAFSTFMKCAAVTTVILESVTRQVHGSWPPLAVTPLVSPFLSSSPLPFTEPAEATPLTFRGSGPSRPAGPTAPRGVFWAAASFSCFLAQHASSTWAFQKAPRGSRHLPPRATPQLYAPSCLPMVAVGPQGVALGLPRWPAKLCSVFPSPKGWPCFSLGGPVT